jgi:hypothetical protein
MMPVHAAIKILPHAIGSPRAIRRARARSDRSIGAASLLAISTTSSQGTPRGTSAPVRLDGAVLRRLGRFLDGQPVTARTATVGYRARKFVRRNKGVVVATTLVVATLLGATVVSRRYGKRIARMIRRQRPRRLRQTPLTLPPVPRRRPTVRATPKRR